MKLVRHLTLAAAALALVATVDARADGKGAEKLIQAPRVVPGTQAVAPATTCPQCKDAYVTVREASFKGAASVRTVQTHQCPACSTRNVTTGHGKSAASTTVHACSAAKAPGCCAK